MLTSQRAEHIEAVVHGRFMVRPGDPEKTLVGFHGYAETAEVNLAELSRIADGWTLVAIQALHPFYSRERVVANWMTSQDRELAIADNLSYVKRVLATIHPSKTLVFLGFSQGAAMAYRAAASIRCDGVIALAGDVPPDVTANLPRVLIGRGNGDTWYSNEKLEKDLSFLRTITEVSSCVFDGAHEWTDEFRSATSEFLQRSIAL